MAIHSVDKSASYPCYMSVNASTLIHWLKTHITGREIVIRVSFVSC